MEHSLVVAIVNGDSSGISDEEDEALDRFIEKIQDRTIREHGQSAFAAIVKPDNDIEFARCDVTGYQGNCYDVTALVYQTH
tara:strand:- start:298 stop:540 length:243 start_codon:yes stop_codon:yes gene_type:complete